LLSETRYSKVELEDIKEIYALVAETGAGLDLKRFEEFLGYIYNIPHHPLAKRLFYFFDKNQDGIVEYFEVVKSLDVIEKGNSDEKIELCFSVYDPDNIGFLDSNSLKELFRTCYINIISKLEQCILKFQHIKTLDPHGFSWKELNDPQNQIVTILEECLPIIVGREIFVTQILILKKIGMTIKSR